MGIATMLGATGNVHAQAKAAEYGAREPRACPSRKAAGAPSAGQARALVICDTEKYVGGYLYLVSDVSVQIARSRPYSAWSDSGNTNIDVASPVYPIQGHFSSSQCSKQSTMLGQDPSRNCIQTNFPEATGTCYKSTFDEWHCKLGAGTGGATMVTGYQAPPAAT
jgi:hypothetical protein